MDFDSLLSAELSKPRPSKKFARRGDIEAERRAAYEAEQAALEEKRAAKVAAKRKAEQEAEEEARAREEKRARLGEESRRRREEEEKEAERKRRKRLGLPELKEAEETEEALGEGEEDVPEEELRGKLRLLGEPAALFGEGHAERVRRLRRLGVVVTDGPVPTTLEPVGEKEMKVDGTVPEDKAGRRFLFRQLASYFTLVLTEYEIAMEREKRDTNTSRTAYNAMVQTRESLKPLFRKFEKDDLDPTILTPIVEIVKAAQERRYVDANNGYLRLSIGKAAWPIGVTMVGIHERSAREKLHTGTAKGHVLGDEVTRKFLQGIKRCLTFAQARWPPTDIMQLMG
ncbi:related to potassium channel regulatory factor [Cephalotrichum gorgonifer]|uniref:Pre-mRNA-splicing factor 18 n=1 Tax=Cephalotrichum gorgonifer TaxID=2041049 RepID=A0AAE8N459_9PEZI|nr:related to potassium channel regulatory factor [Cephalotrichum gorgonifer]